MPRRPAFENGIVCAFTCVVFELFLRQISQRSWLCLLGHDQRLPSVESRDDVLWRLLVDLYLVYLIVREGLRVTKDAIA